MSSMSDAKARDESRLPQRTGHTRTEGPEMRDNDRPSFSLTLRPADFGVEPRDALHEDASTSSASGSSRQAAGQARGTVKRRDLVELAGNPFAVDPNSPHEDGQPHYRQDIYPAYDPSGRRIGLDHVRNNNTGSDTKGYYRKHVHEYDNARGTPLPLPSQVPVQSKYPEHGPLPPVSAVIAGIPSEPQYGVGTFSHIQNRPRTPHEILGLPPGAALNLWSLVDPETPDAKPQYNYHVLVKLAILGNKGQKATLQDILRAIRLRFPYYDKLPKQEAIAFGNSIRHLLSLLAAFVREPKPVTEPGKGSYWRVDFSKGEGNKRVRKRNKPQKKTADGQPSNKQDYQEQDDKDKRDSRSESDDSQPSAFASTETLCRSPGFESPIEARPQTPQPRGGGKGGRKPAPKNLITSPNGGTTTVLTPSYGASRDEFHKQLDPLLMNRDANDAASISQARPGPEPYLQLHPANTGAHRERIVRGVVRSVPYPAPLLVPRSSSSSGSVSASSEHDYQPTSASPVDTRYKTPSMPPANGDKSLLHNQQQKQQKQQGFFESSANHGHENHAYGQEYPVRNETHYSSVSPQQSPSSTLSTLSPYANNTSHLPPSSSWYSNHGSRGNSSYSMPPRANAAYVPSLSSSSSAGSVSAPGSAMSNTNAYGFAPYAERVKSLNSMPTQRDGRYERDESYLNLAPPNSQQPVNNNSDSSRLCR